MIYQFCVKAWISHFYQALPDSVPLSSVRTTGAKEIGRKHTQDLGHYHWIMTIIWTIITDHQGNKREIR